MFVGKQVGSGAYRNVYALVNDKDHVLKVEYCGNVFSNICEMQAWEAVKGTPIEKWFAPCVKIENMGIALIQRRTVPFENDEDFRAEIKKLPGKRLPEFLDDCHFGNYGMLDGQLVCHDYGFNHFMRDGVKVGWKVEQMAEEKRGKRKGRKK